MAAPGQLDWLFALIGWSLAAAGATLLLWSLFWDRPRGRKRCPKCWYDMAGVPGLRCPECGREVRSEMSLLKTRRRRRWAALAASISVLGLGVQALPGWRERGWASAVPSSVLVFIAPASQVTPPVSAGSTVALPIITGRFPPIGVVPVAPAPSKSIGEELGVELWGRIERGELSRWPSSLYLSRLFAAHPSFSPDEAIALPRRWVRGKSIPTHRWASLPPPLDFQVRPKGGEWQPALQLLVTPANPSNEVTVEVRTVAAGRTLHQTTLQQRVGWCSSESELLDRIDTPEASRKLLKAMKPRLLVRDRRLYLEFDDTSSTPERAEIGYAVYFDAALDLDGREVSVCRDHLEWGRAVWRIMVSSEFPVSEAELNAILEPGAALRLRLTGDPNAAGWAYGDRYYWVPQAACWSGEATMEKPQIRESVDPPILNRGG